MFSGGNPQGKEPNILHTPHMSTDWLVSRALCCQTPIYMQCLRSKMANKFRFSFKGMQNTLCPVVCTVKGNLSRGCEIRLFFSALMYFVHKLPNDRTRTPCQKSVVQYKCPLNILAISNTHYRRGKEI